MRIRFALCAAAIVGALGGHVVTASAESDGQWSFTTGFDYTVGDYGQSSDTTITYVPFTTKYATGRWIFGLTVPYIEVEGPGNVTRDLGRFGAASSARARTESGLGDIIAATTYNLLGTSSAALDFTGKLKFGTADRDKGLGTGEDDVYVQFDTYAKSGAATPFATIGYKFLGDPPGVDLRNVYYATLGASYALAADRSVGLMWYGQQKTSEVGAPQSEVTAFLNQTLDKRWKLQLYALLGLADGSPDRGVGAMVTYRY